ncbi:MAG TPA: CDP-alcohol phosphatidyltransferase family protein [Thermodesulfobacteriota bacterium]
MIDRAVLYAPTAEDAAGAGLAVAGRPVAFHAIAAAARAGAAAIGVPTVLRTPALERAVAASPAARARVVWLASAADLDEGPTLLLPVSLVCPAVSLVPLVAGAPLARGFACRDLDAPLVVADAVCVAALADRLAAGAPAGDALARALAGRDVRTVAVAPCGIRVRSAGDAARAESAVYAALGSAIDSPIDVAFHRRLTRPVTRLAVALGIGPTPISLASLALGLAAVGAVWAGRPSGAAAGLALYAAAAVADHADGEVARLTLTQSRFGEWLDVGIDTVIHALMVAAMGAVAGRTAGAGAWLGVVAATGVVASALLTKLWPVRGTESPSGPVARLLRALGARDGFYALLVAFVALLVLAPGALPALMVVVTLGAHAYWVVRLAHWLPGRRRHR